VLSYVGNAHDADDVAILIVSEDAMSVTDTSMGGLLCVT